MNLDLIYSFLSELQINNNKDWFLANKNRYDSIVDEILDFTDDLIQNIAVFDPTILGLNPKDCLFRINRDIRFSANKEPYKTHFGIFISPGGKNSRKAGYYIHIENKNSLLGGGIYLPDKHTLYEIRKKVYLQTNKFARIIYHETFIETFGHLSEEHKLKTFCRDFPSDSKHAELLKYKSYVVSRQFTNQEFAAMKLQDIVERFKILAPFVLFFNLEKIIFRKTK